jgi:hypothetical protein
MRRKFFFGTIVGVLLVVGLLYRWPIVHRGDVLTPDRADYNALVAKAQSGDIASTRIIYNDARGASKSSVGDNGEAHLWLQMLALQGDADGRKMFVEYVNGLPFSQKQAEMAAIARAKDSGEFDGVDQLLAEFQHRK